MVKTVQKKEKNHVRRTSLGFAPTMTQSGRTKKSAARAADFFKTYYVSPLLHLPELVGNVNVLFPLTAEL